MFLSLVYIILVHISRFDIKWLRKDLQDSEKINDSQDLSDKAKDYIKAIHERFSARKQLSEAPSKMDLLTLRQAYGKEYDTLYA